MNRTNAEPANIEGIRVHVHEMGQVHHENAITLSAATVLTFCDEIERLTKELELLRGVLEHIADWPDENMETARTLHYDWRGWAREALGRG